MKQGLTDIICIIDRSGSMSTIAADMRGGFDQFIADQRKVPGEARVTLAQFDDLYDEVYARVPIAEVRPLELVPRNWTALNDAICLTIDKAGKRYAELSEAERPEKVVVIIVTDGHENASKEFTRLDALNRIKHQREKYGWQFVYLGANQDALEVAKSLDINQGVTYTASPIGTRAVVRGMSSSVMSYRSGGAGGQMVYNQADYDKALQDLVNEKNKPTT